MYYTLSSKYKRVYLIFMYIHLKTRVRFSGFPCIGQRLNEFDVFLLFYCRMLTMVTLKVLRTAGIITYS